MKFGDVVIAQGKLRRRCEHVPRSNDKVYWAPVMWWEPRRGLFIGWRTLSNGEKEYISYDDGWVYRPKEHFKVALVVLASARTRCMFR